jgi:hypothetical protein
METKNYTPEIILEMQGKLAESQVENDRQFKKIWQLFEKTDQKIDKLIVSQVETTLQIKELKVSQAKTDQQIDKLTVNVNNLNSNVGGIGNSNGDFAEEYFFSAFKNGKKEFLGEKFDDIEKNLKGIEPGYKAEYDIVFLNGKTVGIIEVKYKGESENIPTVIKKAQTFRINFPKYANHQIYLALAAMSFDKGVENKCKQNGIAIVKQVGDAVVIYDENLTAY